MSSGPWKNMRKESLAEIMATHDLTFKKLKNGHMPKSKDAHAWVVRAYLAKGGSLSCAEMRKLLEELDGKKHAGDGKEALKKLLLDSSKYIKRDTDEGKRRRTW